MRNNPKSISTNGCHSWRLGTDLGRCASDQAGPVWYLAGTAGGSVMRNCTVPAGKALFFPLIANECSYAENPNLKSPSQLIDCAKSADNNLKYLQLSIDGVAIPDLQKFELYCLGAFFQDLANACTKVLLICTQYSFKWTCSSRVFLNSTSSMRHKDERSSDKVCFRIG